MFPREWFHRCPDNSARGNSIQRTTSVSPERSRSKSRLPCGRSASFGNAFVPDDLVELEASLFGLSTLVFDCLLSRRRRRSSRVPALVAHDSRRDAELFGRPEH